MTHVEIFRKNDYIIGYKAYGHSGYSEIGSDIVCSAISSVLQFTLIGLQEVLKLNLKFKINNDGFLEVKLNDLRGEDLKKASILFDTMIIFLKELTREYPKNIKLVEKEEK